MKEDWTTNEEHKKDRFRAPFTTLKIWTIDKKVIIVGLNNWLQQCCICEILAREWSR
jgi:hypothetical protein